MAHHQHCGSLGVRQPSVRPRRWLEEIVLLSTVLLGVTSIHTGAIAAEAKGGAGTVPQRSRPNVIVLLSDDQGWGDLSLSGNTNLDTPHIDSLARDGVSFDRFFVCPVCSPTRAEFLTGRYHPRGGVWSTSTGGERLDLDETTIADTFRQAGYATAAFGKWHNGMQYPYHPNGRGFDEYYGFCSGHWGHYFSPMLDHNGAITTGQGYLTDDFTDHAIQFIKKHREQPFFVYVPYNTPHSPMQVPDAWWDKFKAKELALKNRDSAGEDVVFTRAALAMCENIDWNVGRVLKCLDDEKLAENTIILYFCDNGPNSDRWNGGMKGRKGSTDEGGVRSPLVMRWPGHIPAGRKVTQIAGAIDLLPTLADCANVPHVGDKPLDGRSLKPLLTQTGDAPTAWPERMIYSHWGGKVSVRTQQYRLDHQGKLFDMVADPGQSIDVSSKHPDVTRQLQDAVQAWRAELLPGLKHDQRPFPLGHPQAVWTQLPARDGVGHGGLQRSNRHPNCTFFTNWKSREDFVTWDVEVPADGTFEVEMAYTCPQGGVGSVFELNWGESRVSAAVTEAHDPPLYGAQQDRHPRGESEIKDWRMLKLGTISLKQGNGKLTLKGTTIPGSESIDFRLLMFRRLPGGTDSVEN